MDAADPQFLTGGGRLGARMRAHDWSTSPVGDPSTWPQSLRTAVSVVLNSPFPMLVMWGPQLVELFNDGYADILGDKDPAALGAPTAAVWPELWEQIGPMLEGVMATSEPTFSREQLLFMQRAGFEEETYFTFSYSPIADESGRPNGVLNVTTDVTDQVLSRRRLATLARVASEREHWVDVAADAVGSLEANRDDLPFAVLLADDEVLAGYGIGRLPPAVWPPAEATGRAPLRVDVPVVAGGFAADRPRPAEAVVLRLETSPEGRTLRLVLGLTPRLELTSDYREFCALVAEAVSKSIARAAALEEERARTDALAELLEREHHIAETLQRSLLPGTGGVHGHVDVAARYEPAHDAPAVGGDWYDASSLEDGTVILTVGDVAGHGLEAAATMGQLRSATRALARQAKSPAALLEQLNAFAVAEQDLMATCLVAYVDQDATRIRVATAGHPPALLADPDGDARALAPAPGLPLGVRSGARYEQVVGRLEPGCRLVMHTDGVVERRRESIDVGMERLRTLFSVTRGGPAAIAKALLDASRPATGWADDAAVLVAEVIDPRGDDGRPVVSTAPRSAPAPASTLPSAGHGRAPRAPRPARMRT